MLHGLVALLADVIPVQVEGNAGRSLDGVALLHGEPGDVIGQHDGFIFYGIGILLHTWYL